MKLRAVLSLAGIALMSGGALLVAYGLVGTARRTEPVAPPAASAPIAVAFYAQNHHFSPGPLLRPEPSGIALHVAPKWVERGMLVTDREPQACAHDGRDLHVFTLSIGASTLYAVGFILDPRLNALSCILPAGARAQLIYHPAAFAAADALLQRGKLEYIAHPALRALPQARYQPRDKPMLPVKFH